ncbi:MAG: hypothetical protein ACX930_06015 [Erythrobacter sp.]
MTLLFALSSSGILILAAMMAWMRLLTIDNSLEEQRGRIEMWFVAGAASTTIAIVWTILSLVNLETVPEVDVAGVAGVHSVTGSAIVEGPSTAPG